MIFMQVERNRSEIYTVGVYSFTTLYFTLSTIYFRGKNKYTGNSFSICLQNSASLHKGKEMASFEINIRETPPYIGGPEVPPFYIVKRVKPGVANYSRNIAYLSKVQVKSMNIAGSECLSHCFDMELTDFTQNLPTE